MALGVGVRLGPYETVALIGAGGMGEVYKARDTRLGRDVALKVMPDLLASAPEALARFEREARAVAAVSHPNILAIYDTGCEAGIAYIVTEIVEGMTLRDLIASGPLPPRKAIDYGVQLARGLAAAHDRGIVHRDLKPENAVVSADGQVKILDFGLARVAPFELGQPSSPTAMPATAPGALLGTVGYLSPEQARGSSEVDHRADLFSLGCVLHEMLAGRGPFDRDTPAETLAAILRDDPPPLPAGQVPVALQRVIERCLEKAPGERFQSARDIAFALEAVSGTSSRVETSDGPPRPRRRRWVAAALGAAAVLALLASFVAGTRITPAPRSSLPRFTRLSFERGMIRSARFGPDGATVVYGAAWRGEPLRVFLTRGDNVQSTALNLEPGGLLSISSSGELAVSLGCTFTKWLADGTLARVPLLASTPRPLAEHVRDADWIPGTDTMIVVRRRDGRDRIEFPMNQPVYETTGYVSHARVSADGTRVAFLDHPLYGDDRGFVAIVDRSKHMRRLTHEYQGLEGLAWSPDGSEIWFSGTQSGTHFRIDAVPAAADSAPGVVRPVYEAPSWMQLFDVRKNGDALIAASVFSGTITGRGPGDGFERDLSWGGIPVASVLSADGTLLGAAILDTETVDYDAYVRGIEGTQPVPMEHGWPQDISPDDKWLLTMTPSQPPKLLLVPVGPGNSRPVVLPGITPVAARFFPPDGAHLFVAGAGEDGRQEWLRVRLADGHRETIARPAGMDVGFEYGGRAEVSPDGRELAYAQPGEAVLAVPVTGGVPRTLLEPGTGETFLNWADVGRVFVAQWRGPRARVFRVAVATGRRELVQEISVSDPAGALTTPNIFISRSGESYVYSFMRIVGSLYVVQGLR